MMKLFCQIFFKMALAQKKNRSTKRAKAGTVFEGAGVLPNKPLQEEVFCYYSQTLLRQ